MRKIPLGQNDRSELFWAQAKRRRLSISGRSEISNILEETLNYKNKELHHPDLVIRTRFFVSPYNDVG